MEHHEKEETLQSRILKNIQSAQQEQQEHKKKEPLPKKSVEQQWQKSTAEFSPEQEKREPKEEIIIEQSPEEQETEKIQEAPSENSRTSEKNDLPKRKGKAGKVILIICLILIFGGGVFAGVYYWQDAEKRNVLERVQKEKEDVEKAKIAIAEKNMRQEEQLELLRKEKEELEEKLANANQHSSETKVEEEQENENVSIENTANYPTDIGNIENINTNVSAEEDNNATEKIDMGDVPAITKDTPIGYITKVYEKGEKRYLDIDYIQFFMGEDAVPQMKADGVCEEWGEPESDCYPIGGVYIKNVNPLIRTFEISRNATFYLENDLGENIVSNKNVAYEEFKKLFGSPGDERYKGLPYYIILENNTIVSIIEQFLP